MRSGKNYLGLSMMFIVFAAVFSVVFWDDLPLAVIIGLVVLGFASGVTFRSWLTQRNN
jgi:uncharacterized protein YqhQ